MNGSQAERFESLYRRLWLALRREADPDLSQHEREILHHVGSEPGSLTWLARHLGLPKSTASVMVKDLERRGFVTRSRDRRDERRLVVALTQKGRRRVASDRVLHVDRLRAALARLPRDQRTALLAGMSLLAEAAAGSEGGRYADRR